MTIQTRSYDAANYLRNDSDCAGYLNAVMTASPAASSQEIAAALADVARARGMQQIALDADVSRLALDQAFFSHSTPELDVLIKAIRTLGLRLTVQPETAVSG